MKTWMGWLLGCAVALAQVDVQAQVPQPPEIAARNFFLFDLNADQVLAERDGSTHVDPASLTKLMTAYLVFNALKDKKLSLDQTLPVSVRAWNERKGAGSLMFIDPKMTPKVEDLLKGMIAVSGNDAAVALAEGVGGSVENFVDMMNRQAQAWALKNTQFKNVTGLTEAGHYSSARDVAASAVRIIREHPTFYVYYSIRNFTYNNIKQDNRNLLLGRDPSIDGMKTGFTERAGYCLVSSARRDFPNGQRRLLAVVLGTTSREARAIESQKLLNWGYTAWDAVRLFESGKAAVRVPVWKAAQREAALGAPNALFVAVPRGEGDKIRTLIERTDPLVAPLAQGQRVGSIKVNSAGGALLATVPLVVQEAVPEAGLLGRAWDSLRLWIK
jgi:D-alanyl-D-alanine carboxypeptidase (penicillin-binding protein 5/6)